MKKASPPARPPPDADGGVGAPVQEAAGVVFASGLEAVPRAFARVLSTHFSKHA